MIIDINIGRIRYWYRQTRIIAIIYSRRVIWLVPSFNRANRRRHNRFSVLFILIVRLNMTRETFVKASSLFSRITERKGQRNDPSIESAGTWASWLVAEIAFWHVGEPFSLLSVLFIRPILVVLSHTDATLTSFLVTQADQVVQRRRPTASKNWQLFARLSLNFTFAPLSWLSAPPVPWSSDVRAFYGEGGRAPKTASDDPYQRDRH